MPRTLRKSLGIFWICLRFDKFCFILWCLCALESEMLLNFPQSWLLRRKLCGWMYVFLWYCLCWNTASNPNVCVLMQCWKKWLAVRSVTSCRCCYHSTARLATHLKVVGPYLLRADRHLQSIHVAGFPFLRKKKWRILSQPVNQWRKEGNDEVIACPLRTVNLPNLY